MNFRYLFLFLITTLIWGFAFLVVKDLTNRSTPIYLILSGRFVLGTATLAAFRFLAKSPKMARREIAQGAVVGSALFCAFAAQTWGTSLTTPAKNGMLTGTYVLFVPLFLAAFERKFRSRPFVDALICVVGLFFFFEVYRDSSSFGLGAAFSLISGVFFALHFILTDRVASKSDVLNATTVQLATVAVWSVAFCLFFDLPKIELAALATPRVGAEIIFLGFISTGFAYWTQILAQSKLSASTVSVVACLESIFAVAFSILFGYETVSFGIVFGTLIVLISTIRAALAPSKAAVLATKNDSLDGLKTAELRR